MSVNYLEIGVQTGVIALLLGLIGLYVRYNYVPKLKTELRQGVGLAIGAWMKGLSEEAGKEGAEGGAGAPGTINLPVIGTVDMATIKELLTILPQILQAVQLFGFTSGGGTGGGGGKIGL